MRSLPAGDYTATVIISNASNDIGTTARTVVLNVPDDHAGVIAVSASGQVGVGTISYQISGTSTPVVSTVGSAQHVQMDDLAPFGVTFAGLTFDGERQDAVITAAGVRPDGERVSVSTNLLDGAPASLTLTGVIKAWIHASGPFVSTGPVAGRVGDFTPYEVTYNIMNVGGESIDWEAEIVPATPWLSLSALEGTLDVNTASELTISLNRMVQTLAVGTYQATLEFHNLTNGLGDTSRNIFLTVVENPGRLLVTPTTPFLPTGQQYGTFAPDSAVYQVANNGDAAIEWAASITYDSVETGWVELSVNTGILEPVVGNTADVWVTLTTTAPLLPPGTYLARIIFTNLTTGLGNTSRNISLAVTDSSTGFLSVTPTGSLSSVGPAGGAFNPTSSAYTLTNIGGRPIVWSATKLNGSSWLTLSATGGVLETGASAELIARVNANANALGIGQYNEIIRIVNETDGSGTTTRSAVLTVTGNPGIMFITPPDAFLSTGPVYGPFAPRTSTYTVTNVGEQRIDWNASLVLSSAWVTLSATGGSLQPGETADVIAVINQAAIALPAGLHADTILFQNLTNGLGTTTRVVQLSVVDGQGGILGVTGSEGLVAMAEPGGLATPDSITYTLSNLGESQLAWSSDLFSNSAWLSLSANQGMLPPGTSATMDVVIVDQVARTLGQGIYQDIVRLNNLTNGSGNTTRTASLTIGGETGQLLVEADEDFISSGRKQGPFTPAQKQYTVTNVGDVELDYTVTALNGSPWLGINGTAGTLSPDESAPVYVYIDANNTGNLTAGTYSDSIVFTNTTSGLGTTVRTAVLTITGLQGGILTVDPTGNFDSSGLQGGPFAPEAKSYTLTNTGSLPIFFDVSHTTNWVTVSQTTGQLEPGESTVVVVAINGNARLLTSTVFPTTFSDIVTFTNTTNGIGNTTRNVNLQLTGASSLGMLLVMEQEEWSAAGITGGPFSPGSKSYTLYNAGSGALDWRIQKSADWIDLSADQGSLAPFSSTNVTVSLNEEAGQYLDGTYTDILTFLNVSTNNSSERRNVTLTVSRFDSTVLVYKLSLKTVDYGQGTTAKGKKGGYLLVDRKYNKVTALLTWKEGSTEMYEVEDWTDIEVQTADAGKYLYDLVLKSSTNGSSTSVRYLQGKVSENMKIDRLSVADVAKSIAGRVDSYEKVPDMAREIIIKARYDKKKTVEMMNWDMGNVLRILRDDLDQDGYRDMGATSLDLQDVIDPDQASIESSSSYLLVYKYKTSGKEFGYGGTGKASEKGYLVVSSDGTQVKTVVETASRQIVVNSWDASEVISVSPDTGKKGMVFLNLMKEDGDTMSTLALVGKTKSSDISSSQEETIGSSFKGTGLIAVGDQAFSLLKVSAKLDKKGTIAVNDAGKTMDQVIADLQIQLQ